MPVTNLLLLPGMDGTSDLFLPLMRALPSWARAVPAIYPRDRVLSYGELATLVRSLVAESEPIASKPFALLAESFSTPLAIQIAAAPPPYLKGLVLCAGFAASPIRGPLQWFAKMTAPVLMRVALPEAVIRSRLVGENAPPSIAEAVRTAIFSVEPEVLAARLRAVLTCDVRTVLRDVSGPILYLRASHDRLVRRRSLEEMRQLKPEIRSFEVEGPHFLLQREPEKTAAIVAEFLQELG